LQGFVCCMEGSEFTGGIRKTISAKGNASNKIQSSRTVNTISGKVFERFSYPAITDHSNSKATVIPVPL
jgi:hypothetical protein